MSGHDSTATVRHPTSYTNPLKAQGIIDYGYSDTNMADYEEDHRVPLELGGAPRDPRNLWPEPYSGSQLPALFDDWGSETMHALGFERVPPPEES